MSFEDFDNKIKDAAEHLNSHDSEGAWEKMEALLNKHLPQKRKDNRKILILLFTFLFLGGGAFILVKKPFSPGNTGTFTETNPASSQEKSNRNSQESFPDLNSGNNPGDDQRQELPDDNNINYPSIQNEKKNTRIYQPLENKTAQIADNLVNETGDKNIPAITKTEKKQEPLPGNLDNDPARNDLKDIKDDSKLSAQTQDEKTPTQNSNVAANSNKPDKSAIKRKHFPSNLAFTFSAGPDVSFVEVNDAGRIRLAYGVGLSVPVSKHVSIRSGFIIARKIYTAGPEDYSPSSQSFWSFYPNLKQIDADCKIFDVPLIVDYNFGKNRNWFASLGVSNLFMKRETYNYTFKPASSQQYVSYSHTYNNENRHYFSTLNISGGYSRKLSNAVSLHAEPYLKIPLTGIGHGNIKLGSAGVLLSASVKPFAAKQNQKQ